MQQPEPFCLSHFQILDNNVCPDNGKQQSQILFQTCDEPFFTLDSSPAPDYVVYNSPSAISISSTLSPFSPQCYDSYDTTYSSPLSGSSTIVDDRDELKHMLQEFENELLGPISDFDDGSLTKYNQIMQRVSELDLKELLLACAEAVSNDNMPIVARLMDVLEPMVSVIGEPIQRLGAYMLEGLKARLLSSGAIIYKKLKCNEPTGPELMSYMHVLSQICPYYKFAYTSANVIIKEAMQNEPAIHIIDFQIAQGSQWVSLIQALACRPGGPPRIRITGVDDTNSAFARGGGLHLVGQKLSEFALSCGVPFEFHGAAISGSEVELSNLGVQYGEAIAVNFPYMLHHMPDESVNTRNSRDRLLRLVKSLSPKVVTLLEQESNTNTTLFFPRFRETLDYYTAIFESIDVARPRDDKQRISAEEHCVARDIVSIIACEGADRLERHELLGKWRCRLSMSGFSQIPLSSSVGHAVANMLKGYNQNFRLGEREGALYLGWKNRDLVTCSAWR